MSNDLLQWIEDTIPQHVRASIETKIQANALMTNPLLKQLVALRAQLKENAYQKIFEARASVADDLLKLTQSLTNLIHFSSVAGEDTNAYVSLMRSVSKVTQQLTFFGEDDTNGDGVKDEEEFVGDDDLSLTLDDGSAKPLTIDEAKNPALQQQKQAQPAKMSKPNPDTGKTAEQEIDEASKEPTTEEDPGEPSEGDEGSEEPAPKPEGSGESIDDILNSMNKTKVGKSDPASEGDEVPEEGAEEAPEGDEGEDDEDLGDDESDEDPNEEPGEEPDPDEDEVKKPSKNKPFLQKIEEEDAEAAVAASAPKKENKIDLEKVRFVWKGVTEDKTSVVAVIDSFVFTYKPSAKLFGGEAVKLDLAMRKLMAKSTGYSSAVVKIHKLIKSGDLTIVSKERLVPKTIKKALANPVDKGQLGEIKPKPSTPWRYRGIGVHALSNQQECVWFDVGSKEHAAMPNTKSLKEGEEISDFDNRIKDKIKDLSYDDGLKFILGLVERGILKVIYVGSIDK